MLRVPHVSLLLACVGNALPARSTCDLFGLSCFDLIIKVSKMLKMLKVLK